MASEAILMISVGFRASVDRKPCVISTAFRCSLSPASKVDFNAPSMFPWVACVTESNALTAFSGDSKFAICCMPNKYVAQEKLKNDLVNSRIFDLLLNSNLAFALMKNDFPFYFETH